MTSDKLTGKNHYITFAGTVISTVGYREFNPDEEIGLMDASSGGDVAKQYVTELEDGSVNMTFIMQTGGTAATYVWNLLRKGTEGSLIWGEEGTATGKPKHTVNAIVKRRRKKIPYNDVIEMTFELQMSGVISDSTW